MVRKRRTSVPGEGHSSGELAGGRGGRGPPAPQYPRGGDTPQPGPSRPRSSDLHQATVLPYQSGRRGGHTGGRGGRGPPAPQYPRGGATPQPGPSRPRPSDLRQATMLPYQAAPNNSNLLQFMSRLEDGIQLLLTLFRAVYRTLVIVQQLKEKVKEGLVFLLKR